MPDGPDAPTRLARRLGLGDAVVIGLGSMIGAGIFSAFGPAARAAGAGLLVGLAIAAAVAYCNATSSAALAARYPASGGAYVFGRERLGPFWGHLAGWGFVVGKTASCAAMALTVGAYAAPGLSRPIALAAVVAVTAIDLRGVQRTVSAHARDRRGGVGRTRAGGGRRVLRWDREPRSLRRRHRRPARDPRVGRSAVLRVRRLRAHRHPRRGGARPRPDDPEGDPARARHHPRGLRRRGGERARRRRTGRAGGLRRAAHHRRARRHPRRTRARGARRRNGRGARRAPVARRRRRAHDVRDGGRRRPAPLRSQPCTRGTRFPTVPSSQSAWSSRRWCWSPISGGRSASARSASSRTTRSPTRRRGRCPARRGDGSERWRSSDSSGVRCSPARFPSRASSRARRSSRSARWPGSCGAGTGAEGHRAVPTAGPVGEGGLEPPHPFGHRHLKPARLPIPPLARVERRG